jgi:hypothetical protein
MRLPHRRPRIEDIHDSLRVNIARAGQQTRHAWAVSPAQASAVSSPNSPAGSWATSGHDLIGTSPHLQKRQDEQNHPFGRSTDRQANNHIYRADWADISPAQEGPHGVQPDPDLTACHRS